MARFSVSIRIRESEHRLYSRAAHAAKAALAMWARNMLAQAVDRMEADPTWIKSTLDAVSLDPNSTRNRTAARRDPAMRRNVILAIQARADTIAAIDAVVRRTGYERGLVYRAILRRAETENWPLDLRHDYLTPMAARRIPAMHLPAQILDRLGRARRLAPEIVRTDLMLKAIRAERGEDQTAVVDRAISVIGRAVMGWHGDDETTQPMTMASIEIGNGAWDDLQTIRDATRDPNLGGLPNDKLASVMGTGALLDYLNRINHA